MNVHRFETIAKRHGHTIHRLNTDSIHIQFERELLPDEVRIPIEALFTPLCITEWSAWRMLTEIFVDWSRQKGKPGSLLFRVDPHVESEIVQGPHIMGVTKVWRGGMRVGYYESQVSEG